MYKKHGSTQYFWQTHVIVKICSCRTNNVKNGISKLWQHKYDEHIANLETIDSKNIEQNKNLKYNKCLAETKAINLWKTKLNEFNINKETIGINGEWCKNNYSF